MKRCYFKNFLNNNQVHKKTHQHVATSNLYGFLKEVSPTTNNSVIEKRTLGHLIKEITQHNVPRDILTSNQFLGELNMINIKLMIIITNFQDNNSISIKQNDHHLNVDLNPNF